MSELEAYLQQQGGQVESEGVFTIDPIKARQKLREFQFDRPAQSVLKFVQAAVAWGATKVDIESSRKEVTVRFDGRPPVTPAARWPRLMENPLGVDDRGESHLARGLLGALGYFTRIEWSFSLEGLRERVVITEDTLHCGQEQDDSEFCELRLLATKRAPDLKGVASDCIYSPVPVQINGQPCWQRVTRSKGAWVEDFLPGQGMSQHGPPWKSLRPSHVSAELWQRRNSLISMLGTRPRSYLYYCEGVAPEPKPDRLQCQGWLRIEQHRPEGNSAELWPVLDGVRLSPIKVDLGFEGTLVLSADDWNTDLSGFKVVQNVGFQQRLELLRPRLDMLFKYLRDHRAQLPATPVKPPESWDGRLGDWFIVDSRGIDQFGHRLYQAFPTDPLNLWSPATATVWPFPFDGEIENRIKRELRVFQHPRVRMVLGFGGHQGNLYTISRHHSGVSLSEVVEGGLELFRAHKLLSDLGHTVSELNQTEIVCLDRLNPEKLTVVGDIVLLEALDLSSIPRMHAIVPENLPSPSYMAPEQITGETPQPESDVFIMGAVTYFVLTGTPPFASEDGPLQVILKILQEEPLDPRELRADIPEVLAQAILRCLQKEPAQRPPLDELLAAYALIPAK